MKPTNFICAHKGCLNTKHSAKGYCAKHYYQFKVHGRTFSQTRLDFNELVDCGSYLELILVDKNFKEQGRVKLDKEDLNKVQAVGRWGLNNYGYAENKNTSILMHRLVMDAKVGVEVDHKKNDRLDNRKAQLRFCTGQENKRNRGMQRSNTSGFKGVRYNKQKNKWVAFITYEGKQKHLGYFSSAKEASKVYENAARKFHKEFFNTSLSIPKFYYAPGQFAKRASYESKRLH